MMCYVEHCFPLTLFRLLDHSLAGGGTLLASPTSRAAVASAIHESIAEMIYML